MRVLDIMTRGVRACTPQTSLPQIAMPMWDGCRGVIPSSTRREEEMLAF